ncbi:hypothetical protein D0Y65_010117 [Glycine soja]|uniref:Retrovirus-related Pol polyprotein from transposon TNT 1-94 n=1 Tax=Glycine soja TaxID=3848 RepID=A0A445L1S6_GLYSO|nr:hypothetical protein D0Y65_010117 [Glycine soja]
MASLSLSQIASLINNDSNVDLHNSAIFTKVLKLSIKLDDKNSFCGIHRETISDQELLDVVIDGLPEEYNTFVMMMHARPDKFL